MRPLRRHDSIVKTLARLSRAEHGVLSDAPSDDSDFSQWADDALNRKLGGQGSGGA